MSHSWRSPYELAARRHTPRANRRGVTSGELGARRSARRVAFARVEAGAAVQVRLAVRGGVAMFGDGGGRRRRVRGFGRRRGGRRRGGGEVGLAARSGQNLVRAIALGRPEGGVQ